MTSKEYWNFIPGRLFNKSFTIFLFLFLIFGAITIYAQDPIHDPSTIIKGDDNRYYLFSTGDGVYCMSSSSPQFNNYRRETSPLDANNYPAWIDSYVQNFGGNFWAPDVILIDGYYYVYYSASSFGSSSSAIGVVRTPSLANPQWEDLGMVVYSDGSSSAINAIDPALFEDSDGKIWMSYGSFFGGIGLIEIDRQTGKTKGSLNHIAGGNHQAYEAPYIIKNDGFYYLFLNRASCCNGISSTYYIEVSRSTSISGPYTDTRLFIQNQSGNIIGPGHVGYGNEVLSYHYYDGFSNGFPRLMTTTMHFEDNWPVAGPNGVELSKINGTYALVAMHSNKAIGMETAVAEDGTNIAQWEYTGNNSQKLIITNEEEQWHSIKPAINTTKAFDVYEISEDDGANINLWDYWGGEGQQFCFQKAGDNEYRLINRNSNRCIDVENASQSNGANVIQWGCLAEAPQQTFKLVDLSETGFESLSNTDEINIFPNPSNGTFRISTKAKNATVKIINMQGVQVFSDILEGDEGQISTKLAPGIYLLFINNKYQTAQKIIIKQD